MIDHKSAEIVDTSGPYYNLQWREQGKAFSRYVPAEQLEALAQHTANYQTFQNLVDQYAQLIIEWTRAERAAGFKKRTRPEVLLAQEQEILQLMGRFQAQELNGLAVQQLERLVRTAVFKSANAVVAFLLQEAAQRIDADYQPKAGQQYKGRAPNTEK